MTLGREVLGREQEKNVLRDAVAAACAGSGDAILVTGIGGMGKTSLIRSVVDEIGDAALVGWGTCRYGESSPGFWPFVQAFVALAEAIGDAATREAAATDADLLAPLLPTLGNVRQDTNDPDQQRAMLLLAAGRWLREVAAIRPVIVVLDDLQWADESSLDLLEQLLATPVRSRLVLIGAYRHNELSSGHRRRLSTLRARVASIDLVGLEVDAVAELAVAVAGEQVRALAPDLHRRTGGHPFFVRELAALPDPDRGSLPAAVSDALTQRFEALSVGTREVLEVAAIVGNEIAVDLIGDVLGAPAASIEERLQPAIEGELVYRDGDRSRFSHDLIREAVHGVVAPKHRVRLHAAVGRALAERAARGADAPAGAIARHLSSGLPESDVVDAVHWARRAAREERGRSAFAEAATHLDRVRTRAADCGLGIDDDVRTALVLDEVDCLARAGRPDRARQLLAQTTASTAAPGHLAELALALQRLGARFALRRDDVIAELERGLAAVAGTDDVLEARLTAALARELQHSVLEERDRAVELGELALVLGRRCGDPGALVECLLAHHDSLWTPGTGRARAELAAEIVDVARRTKDDDHLATGLLLQANGLLEAGDPRFRAVLDRWFLLLERRDEPKDAYLVATRRAALALLDGRLDEAHTLMHDAAALGEQLQEPDTGNVLMSQRVAYAHAAADPEVLTALAHDAVAHWIGAPVHAHAVAAGALAAAGDHDGAVREVALVEASGGWQRETSYLRSVFLPYLATAASTIGDRELCRALLDDVEPLATECGVNGAVVAFAGPFAATAAVLAAALGDDQRAEAFGSQARAIAEVLGASSWLQTEHPGPAEETGPTLERRGRVWTVRWRDEHGTLVHSKGFGDIVTLVRNPRLPVAALALASPGAVVDDAPIAVVDAKAIEVYRQRVVELEREIDDADVAHDVGRVDRLRAEQDALIEELRSVTGLGGRARMASGQAERARKAVSARIHDAIGKLADVAPAMARHLDRSITTGLRCAYDPPPEEPLPTWTIVEEPRA